MRLEATEHCEAAAMVTQEQQEKDCPHAAFPCPNHLRALRDADVNKGVFDFVLTESLGEMNETKKKQAI